ncbi:MAG: PHP domain-containing protein [Planctomycetota bacterium]|nr:MAG: PHP domain-containing protein [Planctomycetota bacterium]
MHVHSDFSFDSRLAPADIIEVAIERGLHGVAVCDHNTCEGGLLTKKIAPRDLFIIPGIELGCETVGDVLGLFVTDPEEKKLKEAIETRKVEDFIAAVKAQNGLLVLPHPRDVAMQYLESEKLIQHFDGIETFNSRRAYVPSIELGDGEMYFVNYAQRHRLAVIAGSDAHTAAEIGRARTVMDAINETGVREAFAGRRTQVFGRRTGFGVKLMSQLVRLLGIGGGGKRRDKG